MGFIWISFFIELLILAILSPWIGDFEVAGIVLIGVHALCVLMVFYNSHPLVSGLYGMAYFLRLCAMFWDIYARRIFLLPNSGGDTEAYFAGASLIANNLAVLGSYESIRGGMYSEMLGVIFYFTHPERLIGQYINVLLGITVLLVLYNILVLLEINSRKIKWCIGILAFFPNAIIFSGIFLRESFITTFVIFSIYFFIQWYRNERVSYVIVSLLFLFVASVFHAGVIFLLIGYIYFYMFCQPRRKQFIFNKKTLGYFVLILFVCLIAFANFSDIILAKFNKVEELEDVYAVTAVARGEAKYLEGFVINSPTELVLYGPLRMLYFIASPVPTDWRGGADVIAFFLDAVLYVGILVYGLTNSKFMKQRPISVSIFIMILAFSFVFGIGVNNAGTAMRHRHKILPLYMIFYAVIADAKMRRAVLTEKKL